MNKPVLPSLAEELTPRKRVDLKAIRSAPVDDASVDENSRRIGAEWGAQTTLRQDEPAKVEEPAAKLLMASLRIEVPDYLDRDLAMEAVKQRVTKQYLVLKALQQAGYKIEEAHLVEDGRKAKRKV